MKVIVAILPSNLVTNSLLSLRCPLTETNCKIPIRIIIPWKNSIKNYYNSSN